jgi:hypothetical protein
MCTSRTSWGGSDEGAGSTAFSARGWTITETARNSPTAGAGSVQLAGEVDGRPLNRDTPGVQKLAWTGPTRSAGSAR